VLIRARHVGGDSVYFHAGYLLGKKFIKHIDKKDGDQARRLQIVCLLLHRSLRFGFGTVSQ